MLLFLLPQQRLVAISCLSALLALKGQLVVLVFETAHLQVQIDVVELVRLLAPEQITQNSILVELPLQLVLQHPHPAAQLFFRFWVSPALNARVSSDGEYIF